MKQINIPFSALPLVDERDRSCEQNCAPGCATKICKQRNKCHRNNSRFRNEKGEITNNKSNSSCCDWTPWTFLPRLAQTDEHAFGQVALCSDQMKSWSVGRWSKCNNRLSNNEETTWQIDTQSDHRSRNRERLWTHQKGRRLTNFNSYRKSLSMNER